MQTNWQEEFDERFNLPHWEETGWNLNYVKDFCHRIVAQAEAKGAAEEREKLLQDIDGIFIHLHNGRMEPAYKQVRELAARLSEKVVN